MQVVERCAWIDNGYITARNCRGDGCLEGGRWSKHLGATSAPGVPSGSDRARDRGLLGPARRAIRCSPLVRERFGTPGLRRPDRARRDEGRAPAFGLCQERIPRARLRVLGRRSAAILCVTTPLKRFSFGVGGSGRQPIQSADPAGPVGGGGLAGPGGENGVSWKG